jgi:Domain of unknown function (DUF4392)
LIAIERVSPASDGKPHREHGWDMSRETAPLHLLFSDPAAKRRWYTIGIGDGGNEIGMGSLPKEIIESGIPNGKVVAATTPVDSLIVAGVSNWGGYGLLAAMACTKPALRDVLLRYFNRDMDHRFLSAAVETGQAMRAPPSVACTRFCGDWLDCNGRSHGITCFEVRSDFRFGLAFPFFRLGEPKETSGRIAHCELAKLRF